MKVFTLLGVLSCLTLGSMLPLSAAVIVTKSPSAPTEGIVESVVPSGVNQIEFTWSNYKVGQSFHTEQALIVSGITIKISTFAGGALSKPFTLSIHQADSATEAPSSSNMIVSETGALPASMSANTFLTFTLDTPVSLNADKYYIFILNSEQPSAQVNMPMSDTDSIANDSFTWYDTGSGYARYTTRSLTVYLEGTVAVPEPTAAALFPLVVGMVLLFRKKLRAGRNSP